MQITVTTTLSEKLVHQVNQYAEATGKRKNEIFEESISQFLLKQKKANLEASFKRAAFDEDILVMAEEGLSDYKRQLKRLG